MASIDKTENQLINRKSSTEASATHHVSEVVHALKMQIQCTGQG